MKRCTRVLSLFVAGVLVLGSVLLPAGCGQKQASNSTQSKKKYRIVFFVKNVVNPFWLECRTGADKAAEELGNVQIEHVAPTKAEDIEESVRIVEDTITRFKAGQVDAMVFVPVDYKTLVPAIKKANEAGLPIINYCNELAAGGDYVSFIGLDEEKLAYETTKYIIEKLGGKGNAVILEGPPGALTAELRLKGVKKAVAESPGIKVLASQTANYNRAQAMQVMENLLQQFPKIDAVFAANDETALGAIQALEAAGRLQGTLVSGCDATENGCAAVKAGKLTVTVNYQGFKQGYEAVKAAVDYLQGKQVPKRKMLEVILVDQSNVDQVLSERKAQLGK